ncbi:TfoX/Sxy family protein [Rhodococcus erythropolis]|uniref:TfoX/Sxy family protein n=2 Tax=Rhodococcus TaxID=1827 RepID=UPI00038E6AB5|nr:TfoX/Sxy family protein [Rhodococcus erythropolis]EQM30790.1 transcriptional regulator [Rhodococcus erythropolis DN1]
MSTSKETVARILEQLEPLDVRARAMFGEYGLYCDEKIVGLICGDVLFVKPTEVSTEFGSEADLAPPYPGAKDYYRVPEERLQDLDHLHAFIQRTATYYPCRRRSRPRRRRGRRFCTYF